ncbi:MAG: MFS transporter [Anaerolineae bacterium]
MPTTRPLLWRLIALNAFWFALNVAGNGLDPIAMPLRVQALVPGDEKATWLAALRTAGLLVAILWQPAMGALSDRRQGGRLPFLFVGAAAFVVILPLMAVAPTFAILLLSILLLQLSSNTIQGPLQALVTDYLPGYLFSRAAGFKALFEVIGGVVGALCVGLLIESRWPGSAYALVGSATVLAAAVTYAGLRGVRPRKRVLLAEAAAPHTFRRALADLRTPPMQGFRWWLVNRMLFTFSLATIKVYGLFYVQDYLGLPEPGRVVGVLVATIGIGVALLALPAARLAERIGWRIPMLAASALGITAAILFLFASSAWQLWVFGGIFGIALALYQVVGWGLGMRLAPVGRVGQFLGVANVAAIAGSISAGLVGPAIDLLNSRQPGSGYLVMLVVDALCFAAAGLALLRIPKDAAPQ